MMTAVAVAEKEATRVCRSCAVEKPIGEFWLKSGWRRVCHPCRLRRGMDYHHRHWEKYYQKHKEVRKERSGEQYAESRAKNLELYGLVTTPKQVAQAKERAAQRKEQYGRVKTEADRIEGKAHYVKLRSEAIGLYGGKCECCGETEYDMLTFDHISSNDHKSKFRGVRLVYEVIRTHEEKGYPNGLYRVLCWNCNVSRGFYKYCPHVGLRDWAVNNGRKIKSEMIEAYGGSCVLCGESCPEFLMIDHINGGGNEHRRSIGRAGGRPIYSWLRSQGWPRDKYRLLCANCNCSIKKNKWSNKE